MNTEKKGGTEETTHQSGQTRNPQMKAVVQAVVQPRAPPVRAHVPRPGVFLVNVSVGAPSCADLFDPSRQSSDEGNRLSVRRLPG